MTHKKKKDEILKKQKTNNTIIINQGEKQKERGDKALGKDTVSKVNTKISQLQKG